MNTYLLVAAALLPALVLCIYVYKKDRVEKEPVSLLLKLLLLGAASCFVAAVLEEVVIDWIDALFAGDMIVTDEGVLALPKMSYYLYNFLYYFIGVALIEELVKWVILYLTTRNDKEFNCLFDGMIYAIFVSLGFAALENVLYALQFGWSTTIMRAFLSVPGHMFFGVMMGYQYSSWRILTDTKKEEKLLKEKGLISQDILEFSPGKSMAYSLLIPVLGHGFYDFCCAVNTTLATVAFYVFIAFLYIQCFGTIKKLSNWDGYIGSYVYSLLVKKHPTLEGEITLECEESEESVL